VKGLYKKALAGEIKNFTACPIRTKSRSRPRVTSSPTRRPSSESADKILRTLELMKLHPAGDDGHPSDQEEQEILVG
jgi:adenylylsulfate kinase-like enzyme